MLELKQQKIVKPSFVVSCLGRAAKKSSMKDFTNTGKAGVKSTEQALIRRAMGS